MKTLSIITINKNNAAGLEKTIQSVVCQTSADFEYIIIDGASTDESVEIIKKHAEKIDYWISEPDTGVYNAMNKGIRQAQGNYCLFLNSGDWLISPETLDNVFEEISGNPADIFYSDMLKPINSITFFPKNLTINDLVRRSISHQNSFIKRSLFFEHGFYNENLRIASDWEFFLNELYTYKSIFCKLETNIAVYNTGGISSQNPTLRRSENEIVLRNVFHDFAELVIEYKKFRKSIYYNIIKEHADTKLLSYLLKVYRKLFKITRKIFPNDKKSMA